jgi:long-chain acyl-CoA synthetase
VICAFDLDGTLVGSIGSDRLRPGAIETLGRLVERGDSCVLWSAGGAQYARGVATRHGIDRYFVAFYDKGTRGEDGRYTVSHLDSGHLPDVFVDDSVIDLPIDATVIEVSQFIGNNKSDRGLDVVGDSLEKARNGR